MNEIPEVNSDNESRDRYDIAHNKKQNEGINEHSKSIDSSLPPFIRRKIFAMFLLGNLFLNYDSGVIPASLLEIAKEIKLGYKEQALLGSLLYLGLSFASVFVSPIFRRFGASKVIAWILILNSVCCFIFSMSNYLFILLIMRFAMGATEAFLVIYGPVWVDNYSPKESSATWMGIFHSCTVFGMICGYIIAGLVINFMGSFINWRFAIQIQGIAEIPIALMFFFEKEEHINLNLQRSIKHSESLHKENHHPNSERGCNLKKNLSEDMGWRGNMPSSYDQRQIQANSFAGNSEANASKVRDKKNLTLDTIEPDRLDSFFDQTRIILSNKLWLCTTLGLCSIYFIVTGVQFWMTAYLIEVIGGNPITVVMAFSITTVTAPLAGILVGGTFADKYGGYKGKNTFKAIKLCVSFGFISFVFAFPIGFLYSFVYVTVLLWAILFFGAAIVPVTTGIMISCIKREYQATSSSLSQLIFNLFGYFSAPFLTGLIMDMFNDKRLGFIWGMRVVFWWVLFTLLFLGSAGFIEYKKSLNVPTEAEDSDLAQEEMEADLAQFIHLEIRRRMALSGRR